MLHSNLFHHDVALTLRHLSSEHAAWCVAAGTSKLLAARIRMQQKYLEQYDDLYEDFHIVKLPLLEEEIRGTEPLQQFSQWLMEPYKPKPASSEASR